MPLSCSTYICSSDKLSKHVICHHNVFVFNCSVWSPKTGFVQMHVGIAFTCHVFIDLLEVPNIPPSAEHHIVWVFLLFCYAFRAPFAGTYPMPLMKTTIGGFGMANLDFFFPGTGVLALLFSFLWFSPLLAFSS